MYYVYVLKSLKDGKTYIGYTSNLKLRYQDHKNGIVKSTKNRLPLELVYYQAFKSKLDAQTEERYLKSGSKARNSLKLRIQDSLTLSR